MTYEDLQNLLHAFGFPTFMQLEGHNRPIMHIAVGNVYFVLFPNSTYPMLSGRFDFLSMQPKLLDRFTDLVTAFEYYNDMLEDQLC